MTGFVLAGPMQDAIAAMREAARGRGLRLTVSAPARAPHVAGDAVSFRADFERMLFAAIVATPVGAGLRVDVREAQGRVRVAVGAQVLVLASAPAPVAPPALAAPASARLDGRRVLVADDSRDAADCLVALLRRAGAEATAAYDGQAAVAAALALRPHGVVLDLDMPGVDGCEAARRILRQGGAPRPCLVAVTGAHGGDERLRSARAGFDHHLAKPVDLGALVRALAG